MANGKKSKKGKKINSIVNKIKNVFSDRVNDFSFVAKVDCITDDDVL